MKQKLKKQSSGFTQISNKVLKDKKLSWKAKGLWAYLYSKPDNWDFSGKRIKDESIDGERSTYSGLKELETNGYLIRKKDNNGKVFYYLQFDVLANGGNSKLLKPQIAKTMTISNKEKKVIKNNTNKELLPKGNNGQSPKKEKELLKLLQSNQYHIKIIGLYAKSKGISLENSNQRKSFIKRNLRPAKDLIGYSVEKIVNTLKYVRKNANYKWTLETVGKFIDEPIESESKHDIERIQAKVKEIRLKNIEELKQRAKENFTIKN